MGAVVVKMQYIIISKHCGAIKGRKQFVPLRREQEALSNLHGGEAL